ncbi:primosomal protein N' [Alphaproteobacteria bacterium]|nr:primosomal protein N' [Alphaproteobacteria bacterium]
MYYNILVARPFDQVFTYMSDDQTLEVGQLVIVPFGKAMEVGMIMQSDVSKPDYTIKKIETIIKGIQLNQINIKFLKWVSDYTLAPIGSVLKLFTINKDIITYERDDKILSEATFKSTILNDEQNKAKEDIIKIQKSSHKPVVLEGVTGSGKTEVYFDLIEQEINQSKQILIMVPEISLTPQFENRFKERFGMDIYIWHSKITPKRRKEIWHKCYAGDPIVVIGARSSLFLPLTNLGLTVIDEEHDSSYKQEDNIRYQARDLAVVKANFEKNKLILASATPSLETINNINHKKYHHVFLSKQYSGLPLPQISLVDLSKNKLEKNQWISLLLKKEIEKCLSNKEQALIFLNRRGYSPLSLCVECGYRHQCSQCSSWLVMHQQKKRLLCHQCGSIEEMSFNCPKCLAKDSIKFIGPGVERIAEELTQSFPDKVISVMSSDLINSTKKIKELIDKFSNKEIDIIVATQIMAKGYDFPNLSLVGVIDADAGLFGGDMRAIEKTYNMLQQVSGRAGRSQQTGNVIIQTYYPEQPIIQSLQQRDRTSFVQQALLEREQFNIPPFGFMTSIIISGPSKGNVEKISQQLVYFRKYSEEFSVLGPVEAPINLLKGQFRYRILLKGKSRKNLNIFTKKMVSSVKIPSAVRVIIDVDPYTFM